jgi:hypothetical protein
VLLLVDYAEACIDADPQLCNEGVRR